MAWYGLYSPDAPFRANSHVAPSGTFKSWTTDSLISEDPCAGGGRKTKRGLKGNELRQETEEDAEERETEELIALDII